MGNEPHFFSPCGAIIASFVENFGDGSLVAENEQKWNTAKQFQAILGSGF